MSYSYRRGTPGTELADLARTNDAQAGVDSKQLGWLLKNLIPLSIPLEVDLPDANVEPIGKRAVFLLRAVVLVVMVPALVFVGYAALALQGHREDFPSQPMQTWQIGASSFVLAAALAWAAVRPSRGVQPALVAAAFVLFAAAWASYLS